MSDKKDIVTAIKDSNIKDDNKKILLKVVKQKNYRCDLNITLTKMIFEKRSETKKPNFDLHQKLDYIYDDDTFNKNCIDVIRKL